MRVLVADDEPVSRCLLQAVLEERGDQVTACADGLAAWNALAGDSGLTLAILDWMMPGMDGPTLCRRIREEAPERSLYLILVTARGEQGDVIAGLDAGADDYLVKPVFPDEFRARVHVGERILRLHQALADRVRELEDANARVRQLHGLLPICMYCKRVREDRDYWEKVEKYIARHVDVTLSHGICPDCYRQVVVPELARRRAAVS